MNAMEAQRYVAGSYAEIADFLSAWREGDVAFGDDGQLEYASFGGERAIEPSAVVVVRYECPSQWPGPREPRRWRRTQATCHADDEDYPAYYTTCGVCEDCRLWRWYCWVEQAIGWDLHGELFGAKHPRTEDR